MASDRTPTDPEMKATTNLIAVNTVVTRSATEAARCLTAFVSVVISEAPGKIAISMIHRNSKLHGIPDLLAAFEHGAEHDGGDGFVFTFREGHTEGNSHKGFDFISA